MHNLSEKIAGILKKKKAFWIIAVLFVLILEVFIFNYRFWESLTYTEIPIERFGNGSGLKQVAEDTFEVISTEDAYIELDDVNAEVKNIFIDLSETASSNYQNAYIPVRLAATDEANAIYREFSQVNIVDGITESNYFRLYLSGETEKIKISVDLPVGAEFCVSDITLNASRPMCIHPLRILCFLLLILLYRVFRSKSPIYKNLLNFKDKYQKRLILSILGLNVAAILIVSMAILPWRAWSNTNWPADIEYEKLTDALLDGHFYLNEEPSETLKQMDNPYDPQLRDRLHQESGETYLVDYAYFNGKYYCYFGIVPALLFFVPFKLLFGVHLPTWMMVVSCALLFCPVSFVFIYSLLNKYFKKTSLGIYLILSSVFIAMSSIVYLAFFATVYSVPIILALLFGVLGLTFWIRAGGQKIKKIYLVLGSLCIALIIGCRPQLAIILFFAFPIFWNEIKERKFFSVKGLGNTFCVIVPFIFVGLGVMYYNFARFGSVFDFGANSNLTGNDMTHRGFVLARNWLGVFEYLFQPLNIASRFPFLQVIGNNLQTDYQGYVSYEPLFGGFFWFNPICIAAIWGMRYFGKLKQKRVLGLSLSSFASAAILILLTVQMSGLTQRYMSDFGWFMGIGTVLVLAFLNEYYCGEYRLHNFYLKTVIILAIITIFLNYFNIFILERYGSMISTNPRTLFWVKYVFFTI